jgi:hypothetical protein
VDLREFRAVFNDSLARGATDVLVLLAVLRGREHVAWDVGGIVDAARRRWPAEVTVKPLSDAGAKEQVVSEILCFGLQPLPSVAEISTATLCARLGDGKVLCVRETNHTSFQQGFRRAGLSPDAWSAHFEEEAFDAGRLSNLPSWLRLKSASYRCILYAWHGLRHVSARSELQCPLFQGGNVTEAIDRFKEWLPSRAE